MKKPWISTKLEVSDLPITESIHWSTPIKNDEGAMTKYAVVATHVFHSTELT